MKSVCLFSSYFQGNIIPYYVKYYMEELSKYFSDVVLLTNEKPIETSELEYLSKKNIEIRLNKNEGMDFGMWYKALQEYEKEDYERIGLVNDSCILFKSLQPFFDWVDNSSLDYAGMVATGKVSYHLQSYFLIVNKNAIPLMREFFKENGIKKTYKGIILNYEIGLSKYLLSKGMKMGGYFDYKNRTDVNPSFILAEELIKKGSPIIKKKIISHNYYTGDYLTWFRNDFNIDYRYYIDVIKKNNQGVDLIDFEKVIKELNPDYSIAYIRKYKAGLAVYKLLRKSSLLRFLFHRFIMVRRQLRTEEK